MISPAVIRQLATLSALSITPEEESEFSGQLTAVLDYMTVINTAIISPVASDIKQAESETTTVSNSRPDNPAHDAVNYLDYLHTDPTTHTVFSVPKITTG